MPASEMTALKAVIDVDTERKELEHLAEELAVCDDDGYLFVSSYITPDCRKPIETSGCIRPLG